MIKINEEKREYQCEINGHRLKFTYYKDDSSNKFFCFINDNVYEFHVDEPNFIKQLTGDDASKQSDALEYYSPMPGVVDKINVKVGDIIKKGDSLVVMIAMKMEYVIKASRSGTVKAINCNNGQNVNRGIKLITLAEE